MVRYIASASLLLLAVGCSQVTLKDVGTDHPANPDATEVAPPATQTTLALPPAPQPASLPVTQPMEGAHHHAH